MAITLVIKPFVPYLAMSLPHFSPMFSDAGSARGSRGSHQDSPATHRRHVGRSTSLRRNTGHYHSTLLFSLLVSPPSLFHHSACLHCFVLSSLYMTCMAVFLVLQGRRRKLPDATLVGSGFCHHQCSWYSVLLFIAQSWISCL